MKNILIIAMLLISSAVYAQEVTQSSKIELDSLFIEHPELMIHGIRGDFQDTKLMYETLELNKKVWKYQDRQVKGMAIGGALMGVGAAGWWYTLGYLDPPVYQTSNSSLNQQAKDQARKSLDGLQPEFLR